MDIGKLIHNRRKELNLTLEEIGAFVGVGKSTVKKWETGAIANIKRDKIAKLAIILHLNPVIFIDSEEFECYENDYNHFPAPRITNDYTTFPVIGEIAAGFDHLAVEDWDGDFINIPNSYLRGHTREEFFVLRVKGDSMYPMYQDGDKVLILKQSTTNYSGQVGAVMYDDDKASLKKIEYIVGEDWMRLVPINPNVAPEMIEGERLAHCRVLGIPKLLIRDIDT